MKNRTEGDRLTPCQLAIVGYLYGRGGWVDTETLSRCTADASAQYDHAAKGRRSITVSVHVYHIREKFGDGVIINSPGDGYRLGPPGEKVYRAHMAAEAAFQAAMQ